MTLSKSLYTRGIIPLAENIEATPVHASARARFMLENIVKEK